MSSPSSPSPRHRGGQLGNLNALKHGFYARRLKKRDLDGVEATDVKTLIEEISLLRVFTRRLIENLDPHAGAYELAAVVRILCVALKSITSAMKAQHWLAINDSSTDEELHTALLQFWAEVEARKAAETQAAASFIPPTSGSISEPPIQTPMANATRLENDPSYSGGPVSEPPATRSS